MAYQGSMERDAASKRTAVLILVIVSFVALIDGIDGSIANIALPTLAADMSTDTGTISWVTVTYFMMITGSILLFARIANNGNIKRVLIAGLIIFTVSSFVCGISDRLSMLLIARSFQGLGAGMMIGTAPMLCVQHLPPERLALGFGMITMGSSLGYASGPAIGGFIIDMLSWHWVFLINIPIALIILPLMVHAVPKDVPDRKTHLDLKGAVHFMLMTVLGMYALQRSAYAGETAPTMIAAVLSVAFLAAFIATELRSRTPLINLRVFRNNRFSAVFLAFLLVNLSYMGMLYLIPFYLDINMGLSPTVSGLYLLVPSVVTLISVVPLSRMADSRKRRRAFGLLASAMLLIACIIWAVFSPALATVPLMIAFVFMGLTWAACGGAMAGRIVDNTTEESKEMGSSLMILALYIACAVGTSLYAMIFTMYTGSGGIDFPDLPPTTFLNGFVFTWIVSAVLCALAFVLSYVVREGRQVPPEIRAVETSCGSGADD